MSVQHVDTQQLHQVLACVARHCRPDRNQWRLVSKGWRLAYDSNCTRLRLFSEAGMDVKQFAAAARRLLGRMTQVHRIEFSRCVFASGAGFTADAQMHACQMQSGNLHSMQSAQFPPLVR